MALAWPVDASIADEGEAAEPVNYAAGSFLERRLRDDDIAALAGAFHAAMASDQPRATAEWVGPRASGAVEARNVTIRAEIDGFLVERPAPVGLAADAPLSLDVWAGVVSADAVLRAAPGSDAEEAGALSQGAPVEVLAETNDGQWLLVSQEGQVLGYLEATAAEVADRNAKASFPEETVELTYCRAFTQRLLVRKKLDVWPGAACLDEDDAWVLDPPEESG
ncbi:MAG: SH3 domain-containing protein [Pseudomonadota bacterium]